MKPTVKKFLKKIRIEGVAGVDEPAHGHPGWAVIKSVDEFDEFESTLVGIHAAAAGFSETHDKLVAAFVDANEYLSVLPDEAQEAAMVVRDWLHGVTA